ncbi:MAG: transketolase [Anaerolineales bacterium]|nr:transketolase [Anaerolineales bacterium]
MNPERVTELQQIATRLRINSLKLIHNRGAGHPGGTLSAAEILTVLYFHTMNLHPADPNWKDRDRFILSKGHASAGLYLSLAQRGFFPASELENWGELTCPHQGHPDRQKTPGVDMTSGILGHGVAIGSGLALAARVLGLTYRTYVLLGDGECQAGVVWEGAAAAAKYRLADLTVIVDNNGVQLDGMVYEVLPMEPLAEKWTAYGWHVIEINGHDVEQVAGALETAREIHNQPTVVIAHTTKGKGVSFMENQAFWHGNVPDEEQLAAAVRELEEVLP